MKIAGAGALVIGGASGLGAAVVAALQARGARVASIDLTGTVPAGVHGITADITDEAAVTSAVEQAATALGEIQLLFNCAGIGRVSPILDQQDAAPLATLRQLLDVNLVGTYNVVRLAVAHMQHNAPNDGGERGVIVNTASISAMDGPAGFAGYSASKAGVVAMTGPLALELGPLGIRVCAIAPGMFETPMLSGLPDPVREGMIRHMIFPRRAGDPARFADLALHICENDYLNATTIRIDAGARAPIPN